MSPRLPIGVATRCRPGASACRGVQSPGSTPPSAAAPGEELSLPGERADWFTSPWVVYCTAAALISLESATGISRNRISAAFDKVGLPGFISALDQVVRGVHHYLVELPGVIAEGDKRLRELEVALGLENGRVAALGAFAVPAVVPRP